MEENRQLKHLLSVQSSVKLLITVIRYLAKNSGEA